MGIREVEGTIGQFDASLGGSIYLIQTVEDVASVQVRNPAHLAFVTQTTLSVDDTASIVAALRARFPEAQGAREGRYLLRDAKPPGRRQGFDRTLRSAGGGRLEEQFELQSVAGDGGQERQARVSRGRPGDLHREWFDGIKSVGVTAGASAPEILVQGVIAQLREWGGEVAEELSGRTEHVIFALPKTLREVIKDGGSLSVPVGPTGRMQPLSVADAANGAQLVEQRIRNGSGQGSNPLLRHHHSQRGLLRAGGVFDFVGPDFEHLKKIGSECGANGHIGGIAAAGDQYPSDAALIIARIEGMPSAAEVRFQPTRKIHWGVGYRHADVAEIAGTVTRRNIETTQQCNREMGEIPAHAFALGVRLRAPSWSDGLGDSQSEHARGRNRIPLCTLDQPGVM